MIQFLPVIPSVPHYRFSTVLAGDPYILDVRWNDRDEAWRFDLYEIDETLIAPGIKIVLGAALGRTHTHKLFAGGAFFAIDTAAVSPEAGVDATLDDFGQRVRLVYLTNDDRAALIADPENAT